MLVLRRIAVGIDDQVIVAVVHRLQGCPRIDVDQAARSDVVSLRRLAEVHRERPREDDERLLLELVSMTASCRAGLEPPNVHARVLNTRDVTELGNVPRRLTGLVRPGYPVERVLLNDVKAHDASVVRNLNRPRPIGHDQKMNGTSILVERL